MKTDLKASLQETKKGKLILHLSIPEFDLREHCLQTGTQPKDLIKIIIHRKGAF